MAKAKCPCCGSEVQKYGKAPAGGQRWHCLACGATSANAADSAAKPPGALPAWPLSGASQSEMPGEERSFRRKTSGVWGIRPMPPAVEERHRVVYMDGLRMGRAAVPLAARADGFVIGCRPSALQGLGGRGRSACPAIGSAPTSVQRRAALRVDKIRDCA